MPHAVPVAALCFLPYSIPKLSPAANLPSPVTRVTQLPNGLRVASEETYGQVACVGLFLDSGSKYESGKTACVWCKHWLVSLAAV